MDDDAEDFFFTVCVGVQRKTEQNEKRKNGSIVFTSVLLLPWLPLLLGKRFCAVFVVRVARLAAGKVPTKNTVRVGHSRDREDYVGRGAAALANRSLLLLLLTRTDGAFRFVLCFIVS